MSLKDDVSTLVVTEQSRLTVSYTMLGLMITGLIGFFLFITSIDTLAKQNKVDFEEHLKSGAEYRALNDKRWLRINNALIRLQTHSGVEIPRAELNDPILPDDE